MFSVALPLALAELAPALRVSSVASGAAIAVCFAPEENCAAFAVRAIYNAEREILVGGWRRRKLGNRRLADPNGKA